MGSATLHRRAFLAANPTCAFCGGKAQATTIEHCPPRAMFQFRQWPEGFEFPSCHSCNQGSDDDDLLIAMLARMDPIENKGDQDGKQVGLMKAVHKQFPGLFKKMIASPADARRSNRELGLEPTPGQPHQSTGVVNLPDELHAAVHLFAAKLSKAIYFLDKRTPFPEEGCLLMTWFTNADVIRSGKVVGFEALKDLAGVSPLLKRSGKYLNDQFEYKLSNSEDGEYLVIQARFGNTFGFAVFGSTAPGKLESIFLRLREMSEGDGPFSVLQSKTLAP